MQIGVLGLNHKTASLSLRETFAEVLTQVSMRFPALTLSTCNRSEIYFSDSDGAAFQTALLSYLKTVLPYSFEQHLYTFFGQECFVHLAKVCSGLDSAILGECDIKRQVKRAYLEQMDVATKEIHFVFQKSFQIAKDLKARFAMSMWSYDLPHRVKDTLMQHSAHSVLFVGYSAINRSVLNVCDGAFDISLATHVDQVPYKKETSTPHPSWASYDALVVARHGNVLSKDDPMPSVVIDLGVPRNVSPDVTASLYNIDMLQELVHIQKKKHIEEIARAKELLLLQVNTKLAQFNRYKEYKRIPLFAYAQ